MDDKIRLFLKKEIVLVIAFFAAIITSFLTDETPDYKGAIHFHTLFLLFALMISVEGLAATGVFSRLAVTLAKKARDSRRLALVFGLITCFAAMFLTNDVALLVFVPFAIRAFTIAGDAHKPLLMTCAIMTLGAIVGASLTPIGNPHNLFLYEHYAMTPGQFFAVSVPMVSIGIVLIALWSFIIPKNEIKKVKLTKPEVKPTWKVYVVMLALCTTFSVMHLPTEYLVPLVGIPAFFLDRSVFKRVNYSLLLTFTCFFILVANLTNMQEVQNILTHLVSKNDYLAAVIACQFISNVPASVALSPFSTSGTSLMVGTNVGGLGTIYASMASLITFRLYTSFSHSELGKSQETTDNFRSGSPAVNKVRAFVSQSYLRMWTTISVLCLIVFVIAGLALGW